MPMQSYPLDETDTTVKRGSSKDAQTKVEAKNLADDGLKYAIGGAGLLAAGAALGVAGTIWWTGRWTEEKGRHCVNTYVSSAPPGLTAVATSLHFCK